MPADDPDTIDLWRYLKIIRRRWGYVAMCVIATVGLTAFITLRMTKIYRATTVIRIETQAPQVLGRNVEAVDEMGTGSFWSNVEYYETQYKIIESRDISARVVKQFSLNTDPVFLGTPEKKRADFKPVSVEKAAEVLQAMLTVEPVKDSRLVKIHIDSPDRERARLYADAVAQAYVDKNLESMLQSTVDAVDWLSKQLDDAQIKLSDAEQAVYDYKRENGILSISLDERQNILAAQMTAAATNLTEATAKRIRLQARKSAIAKLPKNSDPTEIPLEAINASPLVQQLKQDFGKLSREYSGLSERYGPKFHQIQKLEAELKRIKSDIAREVNNILNSVDAELAAAKKSETKLAAALAALQKQGIEFGEKSMAYNKLKREKENNEKMYELLIGRTKEAGLSRLLRVNNVHMLDAALLPEKPIKPRLHVHLILSLAVGLVLGFALASAVERADRTVKTQDDLEALGVSFLGIVPSINAASPSCRNANGYSLYGASPGSSSTPQKAKPLSSDSKSCDLFAHDFPNSQAAESCRAIRTNLLFMSADHPARRILVTSPSPQEGKTTAAVNLAVVMAQAGARVLLVDTDLRRPRVHRTFGLRPQNGISTLVLGETRFEEAVVKTDIENMDILMCGPLPPNPSELIHTKRFQQAVDLLSENYDQIIFDSPPVGMVTDAAVLSKLVDGTVLVVRSRKTTRDAVAYALNVLRDIDANILGAVLNDLNLNDRKYAKTYSGYYKKYGGYYSADDSDELVLAKHSNDTVASSSETKTNWNAHREPRA